MSLLLVKKKSVIPGVYWNTGPDKGNFQKFFFLFISYYYCIDCLQSSHNIQIPKFP